MYEIGWMILGAIIWHVITRFIGNILIAIFLLVVFIGFSKYFGVM